MSALLKSTASPRRLELHLPASPVFLDVVDMAAHIYVTAVPGGITLGERVELAILKTAKALFEDGAKALTVVLEYTSPTVRATVSGEGTATSPVVLEWKV